MGDSVIVGAVEVSRVVEWVGSVASVAEVFPDSSPANWEARESNLSPAFWTPSTNGYRNAVQSWVVRSRDKVVVVDTGVGNGRSRPHMPPFDQLNTQFLANLSDVGVSPGDVDIVINTHLHNDHVGWNTTQVREAYVPTFPNAVYMLPRADVSFYAPGGEGHRTRNGPLMVNVFEDSVAPILDSGQAHLWDESCQIDAVLRLESAAGHTPGTSILLLEGTDQQAVFAADTLHSPIQVELNHVNSCFCEDSSLARRSRTRVLAWAEDNNALVFPAHFAGQGAFSVRSGPHGFEVHAWAPMSPL